MQHHRHQPVGRDADAEHLGLLDRTPGHDRDRRDQPQALLHHQVEGLQPVELVEVGTVGEVGGLLAQPLRATPGGPRGAASSW